LYEDIDLENLSNAELSLLSLLQEQPLHAYEIEQVIEERNIRYWTDLGFSSIYRILSKLESEGLLESQLRPPEGRGPARNVFHITAIGKKIWKQAALNTLAHPIRQYSSFLLGLDNLGELPSDEALQSIGNYLSDQKSLHDQLTKMVAAHPLREDFFIEVFFDYILNQLTSEINWLQDLCNKLEVFYQNNLTKGEK
jgi:DNA-binding PadR family transcriptional regulator